MAHADVAIIGGGPAGTAAAIALARSGSSVVVLERSRYDRIRVGEILPPAVRLPLSALGVWDRFLGDRCVPSPGIVSAWGSPRLRGNDFVLDPYGSGWHIIRSHFDRMLATAAERAGARVYRGARGVACRGRPGRWRLDAVMGGEALCVHAGFLIDATGRASRLGRRLGAGRIGYDRLVGVVGLLDSPGGATVRDRRALVESCPDGWWYSAPLPGHRFLAAFLTDADQVAGAALAPAALWWERLRSAPFTERRIGAYRGTVDVRVVAAGTARRQRLAGADWLTVGDAATALDPLCGQGIVRALDSGLAAARALITDRGEREAALAGYVVDVERRFQAHLRLRADYYGLETRWPDSTFWARRRLDGHRAEPREVKEEHEHSSA